MKTTSAHDIASHENNKLVPVKIWAQRAIDAGNPRLSLALRGVAGARLSAEGWVYDPYTQAVRDLQGL